MSRAWLLSAATATAAALAAAACGGEPARRPLPPPPAPTAAPADELAPIPPDPQRPGDARRGWEALVTEGYVGCGVPRSLYDRFAGAAHPAARVERARGAELPYYLNAAVMPSGVEVVSASCLGCHAGWLRGQLIIGLGEASADFTGEMTGPFRLAGMLVRGAEREELAKLTSRIQALAPHVRTRTVGANPADHIAAVLFAHRDPATLAWSDEPRLALPEDGPIPVDVPAWWLLKKKTAMFHTGAGRGDQARIMMTASVLCVDDLEAARRVDAYFPDIRAYILSLEPPRYPGPIDAALAARGRRTFEATCARCHGTYGPGGRYQSRVVPLDRIGTDPMLARRAGQFAEPFTRWFNSSFYGERARLEPGAGYVPPPLDGVWATAPYLHNGSVPNLAALLDSSRRLPRTYIEREEDSYDLDAVGWPNLDAAQQPGAPAKRIYDASLPGYANGGHTFGDRLSPDERAAVIEYLKTL
jgi:cytochrome c5